MLIRMFSHLTLCQWGVILGIGLEPSCPCGPEKARWETTNIFCTTHRTNGLKKPPKRPECVRWAILYQITWKFQLYFFFLFWKWKKGKKQTTQYFPFSWSGKMKYCGKFHIPQSEIFEKHPRGHSSLSSFSLMTIPIIRGGRRLENDYNYNHWKGMKGGCPGEGVKELW